MMQKTGRKKVKMAKKMYKIRKTNRVKSVDKTRKAKELKQADSKNKAATMRNRQTLLLNPNLRHSLMSFLHHRHNQ